MAIVQGPANIYSNYYIMTSYGGWSPCIQGNTAHGLLPFAGSVIPNCVGYIVGRFNEWGSQGGCPYLASVNGNVMINVAGWQGLSTGFTPAVGACMCWDDGNEGHVAFVEQVIDNDNVITTESGWNYSVEPVVRQRSRARGLNGNWGYGGTFQGFIYNPASPVSYDILPAIWWYMEEE